MSIICARFSLSNSSCANSSNIFVNSYFRPILLDLIEPVHFTNPFFNLSSLLNSSPNVDSHKSLTSSSKEFSINHQALNRNLLPTNLFVSYFVRIRRGKQSEKECGRCWIVATENTSTHLELAAPIQSLSNICLRQIPPFPCEPHPKISNTIN